MKLVECVPNFSEGRRQDVIGRIRQAIEAVDGVAMLDVSSDESHNRTVMTFVVPIETAVDAAFAGIRVARAEIDLNTHRGEHPRMGRGNGEPERPLLSVYMDMGIAHPPDRRRPAGPRSLLDHHADVGFGQV